MGKFTPRRRTNELCSVGGCLIVGALFHTIFHDHRTKYLFDIHHDRDCIEKHEMQGSLHLSSRKQPWIGIVAALKA